MTIVFTDNFTVAADTNINAYPAGSADYAYMRGSGGNLYVNAANDRMQVAGTADEYHARIIDAAVPTTGDMEITATVYSDASGSQSGELLLRCQSGADTCYIAYVDVTGANEVQIYRCIAGTPTLIASRDNGLVGSAARTWVFRVEGSGATVTLTLTVAGGTPLVFADTNAARITSGAPGIGGYNGTANLVYVDTLSVDDLSTGAKVPSPVLIVAPAMPLAMMEV